MLTVIFRDLRFRTKFYSHLERSTFLLRHVLTVQRCRTPICLPPRLLALLDVSIIILCRS
jgi:hypothetical protein